MPVVAIGGQETALFLTRGQRVAKLLRLDRLARIKVLPVSIGPPFGVNLLDLPGRVPLPAKITIQILPPIDLRERFGDSVDADAAYEQVTDGDAGDAERAQRGADAARRRLVTSGIPMWTASPSTKQRERGVQRGE